MIPFVLEDMVVTASLSFFPVGNGDMTLIKTETDRRILIDINIRAAADDPDDDTPDVIKELRNRLVRDSQHRFYVDALLITHLDEDHCRGLSRHFHLGPPDEWSKLDDKILIREIWSSPMAFRHAPRHHKLCDDAKAFSEEAQRRVCRYCDPHRLVEDGDRILVLGEDGDGNMENLQSIQVHVGNKFSQINGQHDRSMQALLLGPLPAAGADDDEILSRNNLSTILQFSLMGEGIEDKCRFLIGGDTEVAIWEKLWRLHGAQPDCLSYDILLCPHHCSWHSLSYDSWSELQEKAEISEDALSALSQARDGATIVASSNAIEGDDKDPPCVGAKLKYEAITDDVAGSFECVGTGPSKKSPGVMEFEISADGACLKTVLMETPAVVGAGVVGRQRLAHGLGRS